MPGQSAKWKTPWPLLTESANMDDNLRDMAIALDNIAKDVPQNTLANRPAAGRIGRYFLATDYAVLFRDNGTAWTLASQAHLITSPNPLPSDPDDGMVVDYLADATLGILWRFKYRAAATSSYKWEYQGNGPALFSSYAPGFSTSSTTYITATGGPNLDIPLAGDWLFEYGAHMLIGTADHAVAAMSPDITSSNNPTDDDCVFHDHFTIYNPVPIYLTEQMMNMGSREKRATITSPRTISTYYRTFVNAGVAYFQDRWIKATPLRVGSSSGGGGA